MIVVILLYGLSTLGYLGYLLSQKDMAQRVGFLCLGLGAITHGGVLVAGWVSDGHPPMFDLAGNLSAGAWVFATMFIVLRHRYHVKVLGIFVAAVATAVTLVATALPEGSAMVDPAYKSLWVVSHVLASFGAYAAFSLAAVSGVLYLLQERSIKEKQHGLLFRRLPSLDLLDATGHACILIGFSLITFGLASGMMYAKMIWGAFWSWDPKEVWSMATWLVYAALLHGRLSSEWRGRKAARMAILGFVLALFTFAGVNFLLTGHHGGFTQLQ